MNDEKDELSVSISQAAKMIGVSSAAIRSWEKKGLFTPRRTGNGYRFFTMDDVEVLRGISVQPKQRGDEPFVRMASHTAGRQEGKAEKAPSRKLLGKKWKKSRLKLGYSIEYVARQNGISPSYLYKIENAQAKNASFVILQRLAGFYGEDILYYYDRKGEVLSPFVRNGEGEPLNYSVPGVSLQSLARVNGGRLTIMQFTVEPGCGQIATVSHSGEEVIHIMAGTLLFTVQDKEYEMHVGDSMHYNARQPHSWHNPGKEPALMFWVYAPLEDENDAAHAGDTAADESPRTK